MAIALSVMAFMSIDKIIVAQRPDNKDFERFYPK